MFQAFRKQPDPVNTNETNEQDIGLEDLGGVEAPSSSAPSASGPGDADAVSDLQSKLIRLQADFENYRKRTNTARGDATHEARREMLGDLLPVYDNFLRALQHAEEAPELMPFLSGFEMIRQQLETFLRQKGLEPIEAERGTPFDPNIHEAAGTVPRDEGAEEGTVAHVLQQGYQYKGMLVRPTQVMVYE